MTREEIKRKRALRQIEAKLRREEFVKELKATPGTIKSSPLLNLPPLGSLPTSQDVFDNAFPTYVSPKLSDYSTEYSSGLREGIQPAPADAEDFDFELDD